MLLLFAVAAVVMLIAVAWCIRLMRRGHTSLTTNQKRWREQFRQEESKLAREQEAIPAAENMHILYAAVSDLLRLENEEDTSCVQENNKVTVTRPSGEQFSVSLQERELRVRGLHKVLQSPAKWTLASGGRTQVFGRIDELMNAILLLLRGEDPLDDPLNSPLTPPVHDTTGHDTGKDTEKDHLHAPENVPVNDSTTTLVDPSLHDAPSTDPFKDTLKESVNTSVNASPDTSLKETLDASLNEALNKALDKAMNEFLHDPTDAHGASHTPTTANVSTTARPEPADADSQAPRAATQERESVSPRG